MSKSTKSREEIQQGLEQKANEANHALSESLSALLYEVQPKTQASYVLADAKFGAQKAQYAVMTTVDEARDGDAQAKATLVKAALIGAAVVALLIVRSTLKRRRRH